MELPVERGCSIVALSFSLAPPVLSFRIGCRPSWRFVGDISATFCLDLKEPLYRILSSIVLIVLMKKWEANIGCWTHRDTCWQCLFYPQTSKVHAKLPSSEVPWSNRAYLILFYCFDTKLIVRYFDQRDFDNIKNFLKGTKFGFH